MQDNAIQIQYHATQYKYNLNTIQMHFERKQNKTKIQYNNNTIQFFPFITII